MARGVGKAADGATSSERVFFYSFYLSVCGAKTSLEFLHI